MSEEEVLSASHEVLQQSGPVAASLRNSSVIADPALNISFMKKNIFESNLYYYYYLCCCFYGHGVYLYLYIYIVF